MNWEQADKIFPSKRVILPSGEVISTNELKMSDINIITYPYTYCSRNMVILSGNTVWSKDGDFAILKSYDINDYSEMINDQPLFNVYGLKTLANYCQYKNLDIKLNTREDEV